MWKLVGSQRGRGGGGLREKAVGSCKEVWKLVGSQKKLRKKRSNHVGTSMKKCRDWSGCELMRKCRDWSGHVLVRKCKEWSDLVLVRKCRDRSGRMYEVWLGGEVAKESVELDHVMHEEVQKLIGSCMRKYGNWMGCKRKCENWLGL